MTDEIVTNVRNDICLIEYTKNETFWFHKQELLRDMFKFTYGDFWFVRMPFKGIVNLERWFGYITKTTTDGQGNYLKDDGHGHYLWKTIEKITDIDKNADEIVTVDELTAKVLADGIVKEEYNAQITVREKCRAAVSMGIVVWRLKTSPVDFC